MTAVSSPSSSLSSPKSSSSSSPCHDSSSMSARRTSINIKEVVSKASLASATKRKRLLSPAHCSSRTRSTATQNMIEDDGTIMFDDDILAPRRRFKRRNSKCASMFYQMISPTTLLELQRIAGGTPPPPTQEPGDDMTRTSMMTPAVLPSCSSMMLHHNKGGRGRQSIAGEAEEAEEGSPRWSCTQLRSQMPVTPRGPGSLVCTPFPVSSTTSSTSTHSILAEALRLSSAHLDTMASALIVDSDCRETTTLAEDDDDHDESFL